MPSPYFQKSKYILIDSIEDLNPRKVNIRDLNKKFMDREGNRYALRFDLQSRQIHVVRLAGSKDEAIRIRAEILRQKRAGISDELEISLSVEEDPPLIDEAPSASERVERPEGPLEEAEPEFEEPASDPSKLFADSDTGFIDDFRAPDSPLINEIDLFPELDREITRMTDSMKAIIRVMSRSRVLDTIDHAGSDEFFATTKKIDDVCLHAAAEASRLQQELTGFPKAPLHYLSTFPAAVKKRIEALPDENQQMERIKQFELHRTYSELLKNILDLTMQLRRSLDSLPPSERTKQYLTDLIPSFAEITSKASSLQHRLHEWFKQVGGTTLL